MALVEQTAPAPKGPSLVIQLAVFLVMTAAAIGMGWGAGIYMNEGVAPAGEAAEAAPVHASGHAEKPKDGGHGDAAKEGGHGGEAVAGPLLVDLAPMTTNLAAPSEVWIRLEASLVYDQPQLPEMAEAVHQDLLAYLRTLKMHQIEGSSGYQHLKADIQERAAIRSDGHVKQVLIRTLLFE